MRSESIAVEMETGRRLLVEATVQGEEQVGVSLPKFQDVLGAIADLAKSMAHVIEKVKPDSAEVEFGVDAAMESGQMTALLVKGTGKANVKVTLRWTKA